MPVLLGVKDVSGRYSVGVACSNVVVQKMTNNPNLDIAAINLETRIALLTNDDVVPITNFFDEDGEIDGPEGAKSFVAGRGNTWFAASMEGWEEQEVQ